MEPTQREQTAFVIDLVNQFLRADVLWHVRVESKHVGFDAFWRFCGDLYALLENGNWEFWVRVCR